MSRCQSCWCFFRVSTISEFWNHASEASSSAILPRQSQCNHEGHINIMIKVHWLLQKEAAVKAVMYSFLIIVVLHFICISCTIDCVRKEEGANWIITIKMQCSVHYEVSELDYQLVNPEKDESFYSRWVLKIPNLVPWITHFNFDCVACKSQEHLNFTFQWVWQHFVFPAKTDQARGLLRFMIGLKDISLC